MITRLILIRHGQSEANANEWFAGWSDPPLTDRGRGQAMACGRYLAESGMHIDRAYCSPLRRAAETAALACAPLGLSPVPDPDLREINAGTWEGRPYTELRETNADYAVWRTNIGLSRCTEGESYVELQTRVCTEISRIVEEHPGETILIATHATPVRAFECFARGVPAAEAHTVPWVPNASVTVAEWDGARWTFPLVGYSDFQGEYAKGVCPD